MIIPNIHEAVHAIEDIFLKVGQPIGGELFAHSVGAVVREVLRRVK
jgi:L-lactate utilization protein LutB